MYVKSGQGLSGFSDAVCVFAAPKVDREQADGPAVPPRSAAASKVKTHTDQPHTYQPHTDQPHTDQPHTDWLRKANTDVSPLEKLTQILAFWRS